jgi:CheY-like chemotaxis protein
MNDHGRALTVLVVDDEPDVRKLVAAMIGSLGYSVLTADSGEHALALYESAGATVDLLVADVVAPGMSGPQLAERLISLQPSLKVLFMSGYDHSHVVQTYVLDRGCNLISKPFTASQMMQTVKALVAPVRHSGAAGG